MRIHSLFLALVISSFTIINAQCPNSNRAGIHIIQQGENLYRISMKYNVSIDDICQWNNITINQTLPICSELKVSAPNYIDINIPQEYNTTPSAPILTSREVNLNSTPAISAYRKQGGNRHVVQEGETLAGLAALYGYTEARFREFNAMGNLDEITPGSIIFSTDCACSRISYNDPSSYGYQGNETDNNPFTNINNKDIPSSYDFPNNNNTNNFNNSNTTGFDDNSNNNNFNNNRFTLPIKTPPSNTNINNRKPIDLNNNNNNNNTDSFNNASTSYMSNEEQSMLDEINLLRSDPSGYVPYVQAYVTAQKNNNGFPINQTVVDELIQELYNTPALSTLVPTPCIYRAAKKHGQDILQRGKSGHTGSDGSWPWDRVKRECPQMTDGNENLVGGLSTVRESVIILLIDDGIPNRGHRKTLLNAKWKYGAAYKIGQVAYMPNSWVQLFGY